MYKTDNQMILNEELKTAIKDSNNVTDSFNNLLKELRGYSKEFFFQISIVSAGILSLSVTFIGYVSSKPGVTILYPEILFFGWICETLALIGGLYRNFFYSSFAHYQGQRDLIKTYLKTEKATLKLAQTYPNSFANISSNLDLSEYINSRKKQIEIYERNYQYNKTKENLFETLWLISEKTTVICFGLGIVLIVLFSAINLPVKIGRTLLH